MCSNYISKIVIYCVFVTSLTYCEYISKEEPLYNISKETFENNNVSNVQYVYLERCNIENIHENSFQNMILLETLYLSHNSIEYFPNNIFFDLKLLFKLNLRSNKIRSLHSNIFQNNIYLKTLDLRENKLEELPEEIFSNLILLKTLILSENKIIKIHPNTFANNAMMTYLSMDNNLIEEIPKNLFDNLRKLEVLAINNNKIKILHSHLFENCFSLNTLELSNNLIETLPDDLFSTSTSTLNNDSDFLKLSINLNNNKITGLKSGTFSKLKELWSVKLSFNKITYIEKNVFPNSTTLHEIELDHNKLYYIQDADILFNMPSLNYLTLHDNPWKCYKKLEKLMTRFKEIGMQLDLPTCSQPKKLANRVWSTIKETDLVVSTVNLTVDQKMLKSEIGESIVLNCRIMSNIDLKINYIYWKFENETNTTIILKPSEKYSIVVLQNQDIIWNTVTINNVQKQDSGKYKCLYEREDDFFEEEIYLTVYEKTSADLAAENSTISMLHESSFNATVSDNIQLPCLVTGQNDENMFWSFQNDIISYHDGNSNDGVYRIQSSPARNDAVWYNLTIFNVTTEQQGTYKCESHKKFLLYNIPMVYKNMNVFHVFVHT